jgi:acetyl esterase
MRIARLDMDALKTPYSFVPASSGPAQADSTALDVTDVQIEGHAQDITLRLYRQPQKTSLPVLLYFHGGGFTKGSINQADFAARYFAEHLPALVVSVGYSLAPQFPFPAAPEDAHRAALWVQTRARAFGGNSKTVGVAGHDAGGQLANCLAFIARDRGDVRIAAQALFGPMLDPSLTRLGDEKRLGSDITAKECAACYRAYLPQASQRMHPYAAPLESSRLAGLPATLIATAQNDAACGGGEIREQSDRRGCADPGGPLSQRLARRVSRPSAGIAGSGAIFSVALRCARPSLRHQ